MWEVCWMPIASFVQKHRERVSCHRNSITELHRLVRTLDSGFRRSLIQLDFFLYHKSHARAHTNASTHKHSTISSSPTSRPAQPVITIKQLPISLLTDGTSKQRKAKMEGQDRARQQSALGIDFIVDGADMDTMRKEVLDSIGFSMVQNDGDESIGLPRFERLTSRDI